MISRALVVGAAPAPGHEGFYRALVRSAELVIAADAGAAVCRDAGRVPNACVGDFDSIDGATVAWLQAAGVALHRHPVEKDASDLDLAVDLARAMSAASLDITAAFSGRIDHTIAAFGTLVRAAATAPRALEPTFTAYVIGAGGVDRLELEEQRGTTISLFALDAGVSATTCGLHYRLDAAPLPRHTSLGLSNHAEDVRQRIEVTGGRVLCTVSREDAEPERAVLQAPDGR